MGSKKQEIIKILKFVGFSISAGVVQIVSFELLQLLTSNVFGFSADANYWICYLVSLILSVVWNFTFNRKFTFKSATNVPIAMLKVLGFYAVFTPLSLLWGNALEAAGWNDTVVLLLTMVVNFVTEFLFDEFVVFRDKKKTATTDENDGKAAENIDNMIENAAENIAETAAESDGEKI